MDWNRMGLIKELSSIPTHLLIASMHIKLFFNTVQRKKNCLTNLASLAMSLLSHPTPQLRESSF